MTMLQRQNASKYRRLGAIVNEESVLFRLWAPNFHDIKVQLVDRGISSTMRSTGEGYFELETRSVSPGERYKFLLNNEHSVPDPASRYQPLGVHGPSEVINPNAYPWSDSEWEGIANRNLVIYELHVGTFTKEGTYNAVAERLDYLRELGVNTIELMPLAEFPGRWNWGYDPGSLYAPSSNYGTPDDLRRLVDLAHQKGLAVLLDVVYNHFGPDGCYAPVLGKFFTDRHTTSWGQGMNLDDVDSSGVRNFFIDNALHWLQEYHFDGLRLDATHALMDSSPQHFLAELASAVEQVDGFRRILIAEDERNESKLIRSQREGGYGLNGVWADDFHHQIRNMTAGDVDGYFEDFAQSKAADLAATLQQGWFYTGQKSTHSGKPRGSETEGLASRQFVIAIQNHDQVGNRATGARLHHSISLEVYRACTSLLLFAPQTPLLFMGQEFAASSPFLYFTDHHGELGRLVSEGRRKEFQHFADFEGEVPDPQDAETFRKSKLDWSELDQPQHHRTLKLYQDLLNLRRELPENFAASVVTDRTLIVTRGCYKLLVTFDKNQVLPFCNDWNILLHTEQNEYATSGQEPEVNDVRSELRVKVPMGIVVRDESAFSSA